MITTPEQRAEWRELADEGTAIAALLADVEDMEAERDLLRRQMDNQVACCNEVAAARRAARRWKAFAKRMREGIETLIVAGNSLADDLMLARAALANWTDHLPRCPAAEPVLGACTCGYEAARTCGSTERVTVARGKRE